MGDRGVRQECFCSFFGVITNLTYANFLKENEKKQKKK
jgi:hypothetical protein